MKVSLSESQLIIQIADRSPIGAAALYDQYAATMFKIICCWVQDKHIAETVLEETLITVWHRIDDYGAQDQRLLLWMAGIARQLSREKAKSRDR